MASIRYADVASRGSRSNGTINNDPLELIVFAAPLQTMVTLLSGRIAHNGRL